MSIRKIAQTAGLSPAAVSMALRNNPKISVTTRRRVLRIAKRLGYKPDAKVVELMNRIRLSRSPQNEACFGVISFYDTPRPWEISLHLGQMYRAMLARAAALGYRLEPFWLRAPGMTCRRMRSILDVRGIQGLLCFGSPRIDEEFPSELDHFAVVTQGLSIRTPLHRVVNDAYNDTRKVLDRVHRLGYRRPGLILSQYEDVRGAHANLSAYYGWCQQTLGTPQIIPVLRIEEVAEKPLLDWLQRHRPDVLVVVHTAEVLRDLMAILRRLGPDRGPREIGLVALSQVLRHSGVAGLEENDLLLGEWAVELLVGRIIAGDFAIPQHPRIEMVEGVWVEGRSLRRQDP